LFSSKSVDYNSSNDRIEDKEMEVESLRSQLAYQETLTRTLFAENERLREEVKDEIK